MAVGCAPKSEKRTMIWSNIGHYVDWRGSRTAYTCSRLIYIYACIIIIIVMLVIDWNRKNVADIFNFIVFTIFTHTNGAWAQKEQRSEVSDHKANENWAEKSKSNERTGENETYYVPDHTVKLLFAWLENQRGRWNETGPCSGICLPIKCILYTNTFITYLYGKCIMNLYILGMCECAMCVLLLLILLFYIHIYIYTCIEYSANIAAHSG